jgi:hypothetical protein
LDKVLLDQGRLLSCVVIQINESPLNGWYEDICRLSMHLFALKISIGYLKMS